MSRQGPTPEEWRLLVEAYREMPGAHAQAAAKAGITHTKARRAYLQGWPRIPFAKTPIQDILAEEQLAVRAARQRQEQRAAEQEADRLVQARLDAMAARAEEAQGAKVIRNVALNLGVITAKLLLNVDAMTEEINARLKQPGAMAGLSVKEMQHWMRLASWTARDAARVMSMALSIERVVAGEPIAILGVKVESMTPEQMVESLQGIQRTVERAARIRTDDEPAPQVKAQPAHKRQPN